MMYRCLCGVCGGRGVVVYGSDTETGRISQRCVACGGEGHVLGDFRYMRSVGRETTGVAIMQVVEDEEPDVFVVSDFHPA